MTYSTQISLYAIGFAIGPALASTASELWGRGWIIKGSLLLCLVFTVVSGSATTFRTMIVARVLAGVVGSASITPLLGVCNDMYSKEQNAKRDTLISLYGSSMAWASILGPITAEAVVTQHDENWRWMFWLLAILLAVSFLLILPLPETYKPEMCQETAKRQELQGRNILAILVKVGLERPLHVSVHLE
jgi:MFS family permease